MQEIWKDIEGFEDYQISNTGRIMTKPKELKPKISSRGLLEIALCREQQRVGKMLGRLVYETFSGKQLTKNDVVIYKDGNKANCNFDNLEVVTRGKRQEIAYEKGERKARKFEYHGEYLTVKQIAQKTGMKQATIEKRLCRWGWNIYEAAEIPKNVYKRKEIE